MLALLIESDWYHATSTHKKESFTACQTGISHVAKDPVAHQSLRISQFTFICLLVEISPTS